MSKQNATEGGVSLPVLLVIIFFILKVTHTINWSWWWIFAPLWIPAALVLLLAFSAALIALGGGRLK